jgi:hypothetical protein
MTFFAVLSVSLRLGGKELFAAEAQRYAERQRTPNFFVTFARFQCEVIV